MDKTGFAGKGCSRLGEQCTEKLQVESKHGVLFLGISRWFNLAEVECVVCIHTE